VSRRAEIAANLETTRTRIAAACAAAGRSPDDVVLVAVTKTWPVADVRILADLGVRDVGENRDQEARDKHAGCADLDLRWHFVGQLQRNKVSSVVTYSDVVHSVDRLPLVAALGRAAQSRDRSLVALVQVSLDTATAGRGGVQPDEVAAMADAVAATAGLTLGGLMAVAPLGADADEAFGRLAVLAAGLRRSHPQAGMVSAGMTGDLEAAIRHGATHVRVGTALLGRRSAPVG
jgi:PLP dependent protein